MGLYCSAPCNGKLRIEKHASFESVLIGLFCFSTFVFLRGEIELEKTPGSSELNKFVILQYLWVN